jgi:hypothetical protein
VTGIDSPVTIDFLIVAVFLHTPCGLRRKIKQRADRAGSLLARPQFEHLAEQDQYGDGRRRFEIDRDCAIRTAESRGKYSGRKRADHAVEPRDARTHRDEREHVEVARHDRPPAADEERPARPQHDRSGDRKLDPIR